jgi:hypothetical protein
MTKKSQLAIALEILEASEVSMRSARQILLELVGHSPSQHAHNVASQTASSLSAFHEDDAKVVEGVFNGESMSGSDKNIYPVPANYASKSKLVEGDVLKLTITNEGRLIYKQISLIDRKTLVGKAVVDDDKIKILAQGKLYLILFASVSFFKINVGDQVSILLPQDRDATWGTVEAVLPSTEDIPQSIIEDIIDNDENVL